MTSIILNMKLSNLLTPVVKSEQTCLTVFILVSTINLVRTFSAGRTDDPETVERRNFEEAFLSLLELGSVPKPGPEKGVTPEYVQMLYREMVASMDTVEVTELKQMVAVKPPAKIVAVGAKHINETSDGLNLLFPVPPDVRGALTRVELVFVRRDRTETGVRNLLSFRLATGNKTKATVGKNQHVTSTHGLWDVGIVTDLITSLKSQHDVKDTNDVFLTLRHVDNVTLSGQYHVEANNPYLRPEMVYYFNIDYDIDHTTSPEPEILDAINTRHRRSAGDDEFDVERTDNNLPRAGNVSSTTTTTTTTTIGAPDPTPSAIPASEHPGTTPDTQPRHNNVNTRILTPPTARTPRQPHVHAPDEQCSFHRWHVQFADMGWDFIIEPSGYNANYCHGLCEVPHLRSTLNVTNHAFLKSTYKSYVGLHNTLEIPEARCVPIALSPLSLLYRDKDGESVVQTLPEMVADQCGCF